ncbi:hypothetical protein DV515_00017997, partial [Chloebia gouldiae]
CYEEIVALEQAEDRIATLEEENGSLRELVEEMRAALQSSDARCPALQVSPGRLLHRPPGGGWAGPECFGKDAALGKSVFIIPPLPGGDRSCSFSLRINFFFAELSYREALRSKVGLWKSHASHTEEGSCFTGSKRPLTQKHSQTKCLQSVLEEMDLIWCSRNGQIEEAIRLNRELERELKSSQEALLSLEDFNRNLKREQAEMRRKVEEARHAVLNSLGKVKELEARANEVPHLQIYIQQLESQLQHYSVCSGEAFPGFSLNPPFICLAVFAAWE